MLLDIDGDGLLDRVTDASTEATDGQCRANWRRNLGPPADSSSTQPQFGPEQLLITLPRLKWNGPTVEASPLDGAPAADPLSPHLEDCALNGQVTAFRNSYNAGWAATMGPRAWRAPRRLVCSAGLAAPSARGSDAYFTRTYLTYRWMDMDADGLVDLVAAVHGDINTYDIVQGNGLFNGVQRPPEPDLFGPWPACPGHAITPNVFEPGQVETCKDVDASCMADAWTCTPGDPCTINWATVNACLAQAPSTGCYALTQVVPSPQRPQARRSGLYRGPYTRCEGLYPWFIYKNTGNGTFASSPVIKYQPIPLESDTGDSSIIGRPMAQYHGVVDFDGDGVLDVLVHPNTADARHWFVWLGDGTGGFGPRRYTFPTRPAPRNKISGSDTTNQPSPSPLVASVQELGGTV